MKTVYKYPIPMDDKFTLSMPYGAEVLSVATQSQEPFMWALVDTDHIAGTRTFYVRGTGHEVDMPNPKHLGTFQLNYGQLVFHLFESDPAAEYFK